jgi:tetratricopeptide (TPR) repeat protein
VHRPGNVPLVPLVAAADVDEERRLRCFEELARGLGVDLVDLRLDSLQEIPVAGHWFQKYSDGIVAAVSPRARVALVVALVAAVAAAAVVGATVLIWGGDSHAARQPVGLRAGAPPFDVGELGLRNDAEARRVRRAAGLYNRGRRAAAARLLAGDENLVARVGAALARWPTGTITDLDTLARSHPRSAFVRLHLGLALAWARRNDEARRAWQDAQRVDPDSPSALRAEDLRHPEFAPGRPTFVPAFDPPASLARLPFPRQIAALARSARRPDVRAKLLYGVALQRLERPLSAERQYAAAAALAPRNPEARVAAAVGLFDKDRPALAFSRLGPLVRTFPRAPTVRFHLGLLLLWSGRVDAATVELRRARAEGPQTRLGRAAAAILTRIRR